MPPEPGPPTLSAARCNGQVIAALLAELDRLGVNEFCVAAGARNAPLLEVLQRREDFTIYPFVEERSAAFFALGRIMDACRPVSVVTTSGTAVAELFPAVMEAYYQALPLVAVTADRPSRYRGSGAPQAVEQPGIFGEYVCRSLELEHDGTGMFESEDVGPETGPIHINVCLEECLAEIDIVEPDEVRLRDAPRMDGGCHDSGWEKFFQSAGGLIVLAAGIHPQDVPAALDFLLRLGAPVVAEATSNLLADPVLQPLLRRGGERALAACTATRVIRLGCVPSWRWWRDLEAREDVAVLNISRAPFRGLARDTNVTTLAWEALETPAFQRPPSFGESQLPSSVDCEINLAAALEAHPRSEPAWMRHLSRVIGPASHVLLGNSLPIREWNLAADRPQPGVSFFANRGANGIDGLVSTWLGLSAEVDASWLIIGDLSTIYDLGAPWILPHLFHRPRRIVIINNGGGKIFSRLGWLKQAGKGTHELMVNPHGISFEPWARMWGMGYHLIEEPATLPTDQGLNCQVWEIRPDPEQTEAFWVRWQRK